MRQNGLEVPLLLQNENKRDLKKKKNTHPNVPFKRSGIKVASKLSISSRQIPHSL